jgi:hypothetical protein
MKAFKVLVLVLVLVGLCCTAGFGEKDKPEKQCCDVETDGSMFSVKICVKYDNLTEEEKDCILNPNRANVEECVACPEGALWSIKVQQLTPGERD